MTIEILTIAMGGGTRIGILIEIPIIEILIVAETGGTLTHSENMGGVTMVAKVGAIDGGGTTAMTSMVVAMTMGRTTATTMTMVAVVTQNIGGAGAHHLEIITSKQLLHTTYILMCTVESPNQTIWYICSRGCPLC